MIDKDELIMDLCCYIYHYQDCDANDIVIRLMIYCKIFGFSKKDSINLINEAADTFWYYMNNGSNGYDLGVRDLVYINKKYLGRFL